MSSSIKVDPLTVVIVGCGGIGTRLAEELGGMLNFQAPESSLILVDGDSFEPKNRERQHFSSMGPKAQVLKSDLQRRYDQIYTTSMHAWVVSEAVAEEWASGRGEVDEDVSGGIEKISAYELIKDADVVFAVVDNFAARKEIAEAAKLVPDIDVYFGGNGEAETDERLFATAYLYRRRDGQDLTVNPVDRFPEYFDPSDRNPGEMSCSERAAIEGGAQLGVANALASTFLAAIFAEATFMDDSETDRPLRQFGHIYINVLNATTDDGVGRGIDRCVAERQEEAAVAV